MIVAPVPSGTVHIRFADGLFVVETEPADRFYPRQTFAMHRSARGFAGGIRMCRGWRLIDHTMTLPPSGEA